MKSIICATVLVFAFFANPSNAQNTSACASLRAEIDRQEKELAAIQVDGLTDNSAPRAALRQQKRTNALALVAISVDLMGQHKCPPLAAPIDELAYLSAALACETALLERKTDTPACKRGDWQRGAK